MQLRVQLPRNKIRFFDMYGNWEYDIKGGFRISKFKKKAGQTTVELLLMLPVFLLIVFSMMEIGNIAFQHIVANHCAYELARIGSLTAGPPGGMGMARARMEAAKSSMFPNPNKVNLSVSAQVTGRDPQGINHINADLIVTLNYRANLVFPISKYLMSKPVGTGEFPIIASVRMPIENPPE